MSFQRDKNRFIKHFKGNGRRMSAGCLHPTLKLPKKSASHTSSHFQTSENELSLYGQKLLKDVLHQNKGGNLERVRDEIQETGSGGQGMGITETVEKEIPRWTAMSQAGKQPV